jgi:nuclear respiratory factor 1
VTNCYKFHGREDLLPQFSEDDENNAGSDAKSEQKSHQHQQQHQQQHHQQQQQHSRQTATVVSFK